MNSSYSKHNALNTHTDGIIHTVSTCKTPLITNWDGVMAELFDIDGVNVVESCHDSSSGIASDEFNVINSSPPSSTSTQDSPSHNKLSKNWKKKQRSYILRDIDYGFGDDDDDDIDDEDDDDDGYGGLRSRKTYSQAFSSDSGDCRSLSTGSGDYRNNKFINYQSQSRCRTRTPIPQTDNQRNRSKSRDTIYSSRTIFTQKETYTTQEMHIQDSGRVLCDVKRRSKVDYFELLPDDIIFRIFNGLPSDQLCRNTRVCRRWYDIIWQPTLWSYLKLNNPELDIDRALKILLRRLSSETPTVCLMVEKIILNGCEMLTDKGLHSIAKKCPELRHLEVSGCSHVTNIAIFEIVSKCINLEHLNTTGCPCVTCICLTPEATVQATTFGKQIYLRFLDMTDCFNLDDAGLQIIASYCSQLVFLYLRRCFKVTDIGVQYVSNYCSNVRELSISDCRKVSDFGMKEISKIGSGLRYLSVAKCDKISDVGVKYIAQHCHRIRYLNLRGCEGVSDISVELLALHCQRIKSLDIGKCDITDDGLKILSENAPQLRRLSLKACDAITDTGIVTLAVKCRQLQQLNIQECHLSSEAYRAVKKYCKRCLIEHTNPGFY